MSDIKIKSKNLNVYYGDKQALFDVNLDLNEKEVTALIGPSGCGKSTFIRCINRMNDVIDICKVEGNIEIDGIEISDKELDVVSLRERAGMVFQKPISVNPEVILMDEPCSALDPIATAKIEELIDELKKTYTIVIVTHSMAQAVRVSQKTGFFHLGKLIEVGKTEKIFKNPDNKMTQDYITGRFG